MPRERGFTLIELTIAVAIVAMITAAGVGLTLASRSLAVTTAANEFDQMLDSARTIAHEVGGGRLTFAAEGDGTVATFAAVDADGALVPTTLPALHTQARFAEQEVLGDPAFALVLHADGRLGGIPNAGSAEVGCPAAGSYHIRIAAGGGSADRYLPCRTTLAGGTLAYTGWTAATTAPSPAPDCGDACTPGPLPTAPSPVPTPTCPAGTTPSGNTCVPVAPTTPTPAPTPTPAATATPPATPTATATPAATPTPTATPVVACDLVQSGTCYRRIQGPTLETFDKVVSPDYTCDESTSTCQWVNRVGQVSISAPYSYSFQPPIIPDDAHRLLFVVDGVIGLVKQCATFQTIVVSAPPPPVTIPWYNLVSSIGYGNGIRTSSAVGYGEPNIYAYRHSIITSPFPSAGMLVQTNVDATQFSSSIDDFVSSVQEPLYGPTVSWTYLNQTMSQGSYVTYVPDFTDCASGLPMDRQIDSLLYGFTEAILTVEVYQALPG